MRVLILSWEYPPHLVGGLGKHVLELVTALAGQGVEVHVVTPNFGHVLAHEQLADGAMVHRVDVPAHTEGDWLAYVRDINDVLDRCGADGQRNLWSL